MKRLTDDAELVLNAHRKIQSKSGASRYYQLGEYLGWSPERLHVAICVLIDAGVIDAMVSNTGNESVSRQAYTMKYRRNRTDCMILSQADN